MYDYERLRLDLREYYLTAQNFGFSRKLIEVDLKRVEEADGEELLEIAAFEDFDVSGYEQDAG